MTRTRDLSEAVVNAAAGFVISLLLVEALRAAGLWDAPALVVALVFFAVSIGRAFVLRRLFRAREGEPS